MSSGKVRRVAVIPARGGSKRLPRKNIVDFLGKPIIAYTIEAALDSGLFERLCVTTEDDEIAAVSARYGATVISRRREMASDDVQLMPVILDFVENEEREGRTYDELCVLLATAPMRNTQDIRGVMALLEPGKCEFSMAVTEYDLSPHQALIADDHGTLRAAWPELVNKQKQNVPKYLCDNGSTYGFIVEGLKREKTFYGSTLSGYLMPRERSVDIDVSMDLDLAKMFAKRLGNDEE